MPDARRREVIPPATPRPDATCNMRPTAPRFRCFLSGDGIRASQHPALQSLHALFVRRHNQHADALAQVNPHWTDEQLYQGARYFYKVVIYENSNENEITESLIRDYLNLVLV